MEEFLIMPGWNERPGNHLRGKIYGNSAVDVALESRVASRLAHGVPPSDPSASEQNPQTRVGNSADSW
jgi:hypothetical protein